MNNLVKSLSINLTAAFLPNSISAHLCLFVPDQPVSPNVCLVSLREVQCYIEDKECPCNECYDCSHDDHVMNKVSAGLLVETRYMLLSFLVY